MDFAQYYHQYGPMMDDRGHGDWVGPLFGFLCFLLILGVIVYGIRTLAAHHPSAQLRDPLDIAKERFAKGEISKEELNDIKKELK